MSRAFMAGASSQAGDADSSRAPGLTSGLQGSVNVHRGALLFVPQWQCISSFVFYIFLIVWSCCVNIRLLYSTVKYTIPLSMSYFIMIYASKRWNQVSQKEPLISCVSRTFYWPQHIKHTWASVWQKGAYDMTLFQWETNIMTSFLSVSISNYT